MKKLFRLSLIFICIFLLTFISCASSTQLIVKKERYKTDNEPYKGYTLFGPMWDSKTYLINNDGKVVFTWDSFYIDSQASYLLENGNLVRTSWVANSPMFSGGAQGRIEIFNSKGDMIWSYEYSSSQYNQHHDVEILPNGNILLIAWELKTKQEAILMGRNPNYIGDEFWPDYIVEIKPVGDSDINIVWEWHVWDHIIQDFDPSKENYGIVSEHPELIDINYCYQKKDWNHINSIDYNEKFDQILLCVRMFNEIWIIDHSTTTQEAAGHTGGRYGKGGDILYRWGNPQAYKHGTSADRKYFNQHAAMWIEEGCPGENNIIVFNNGQERPDGRYSSVDEIIPPVNEYGIYNYLPGSAYEPKNQIWIYTMPNPSNMFSIICSSAQRLPNGNTLICSANQGMFLEVNYDKEIVWRYDNPYPISIRQKTVTEAIRYPTDYPGIPDSKIKSTNVKWFDFDGIFNQIRIILHKFSFFNKYINIT